MKRGEIILLIGILFGSFFLRIHNYSLYPQRGATSDEYAYPFLGVSLLTHHKPISWSAFSDYKHRENLTIHGIYFPIVWPYLDHPPLYGLLTGSYMLLAGQTSFPKMDIATVRIIPLLLAIISSYLVFLLAQRLYGYTIGIWSLLIFSTVTVFVMNMRIGVAENLLTCILLGALNAFLIFEKKFTYKKIIFLGLLSGCAFLTKVLGIVVFLSILFFLLRNKVKFSYISTFCVIFLLLAGFFLVYGALYDWNLFLTIQKHQSHRPIGPEMLPYILSTPIIVNKIVYDGWYIFGFIALFVLCASSKKHLFLVIPFLTYLLLLLLSLTKQGQSGWYLIPLFPFMAIASATCIQKSIQDNTVFFFIFLFIIGMSEMQTLYEPLFGLNQIYFRILTFLLLSPPLFATVIKNKKYTIFIKNFYFYIFIAGNILFTYNYIHPA